MRIRRGDAKSAEYFAHYSFPGGINPPARFCCVVVSLVVARCSLLVGQVRCKIDFAHIM